MRSGTGVTARGTSGGKLFSLNPRGVADVEGKSWPSFSPSIDCDGWNEGKWRVIYMDDTKDKTTTRTRISIFYKILLNNKLDDSPIGWATGRGSGPGCLRPWWPRRPARGWRCANWHRPPQECGRQFSARQFYRQGCLAARSWWKFRKWLSHFLVRHCTNRPENRQGKNLYNVVVVLQN